MYTQSRHCLPIACAHVPWKVFKLLANSQSPVRELQRTLDSCLLFVGALIKANFPLIILYVFIIIAIASYFMFSCDQKLQFWNCCLVKYVIPQPAHNFSVVICVVAQAPLSTQFDGRAVYEQCDVTDT